MSDIPRFPINSAEDIQMLWNIENGPDVMGFCCPGCGEDTNTEICYDVDTERDPMSVTESAYCNVECYIDILIEELQERE